MEPIADLPTIPDGIRRAAQQGRLVIFVGAGISRLAGSPSWEKFADGLLEQLAQREYLSFGDLRQLEGFDPKKKLSIGMDVCRAVNFRPDFRSLLASQQERERKVPQIYAELYSLGTAFVATNYDEWLDELAESEQPALEPMRAEKREREGQGRSVVAVPKRVFFRRQELTIDTLGRAGNVVHLHGSVKDPDTMVMTTAQYFDHYQDDTVKTFLTELFTRYVVLFLGYSAEEEEILEHVVRKQIPGTQGGQRIGDHYRLYPRFQFEAQLFEYLKAYSLNHCGIELIEYRIDRRGHVEVGRVVTEWVKALKAEVSEPRYLDRIRIIDEALS